MYFHCTYTYLYYIVRGDHSQAMKAVLLIFSFNSYFCHSTCLCYLPIFPPVVYHILCRCDNINDNIPSASTTHAPRPGALWCVHYFHLLLTSWKFVVRIIILPGLAGMPMLWSGDWFISVLALDRIYINKEPYLLTDSRSTTYSQRWLTTGDIRFRER